MALSTRFYTTTLSASALTIIQEDNVTEISILSTSGATTITGNYPFRATENAAISLAAGQSVTVSARSPNSPIDGLTINAAGTAVLILSF